MHMRIGDLVVDMEAETAIVHEGVLESISDCGWQMVSYVRPLKFPP